MDFEENPYHFPRVLDEEDFERGRIIGRIESKIYHLLEIARPRDELDEEVLYKILKIIYDGLNDVAEEFETL